MTSHPAPDRTTAPPPTPAESPLFIVGCERSGTTLLRVMLDRHPDLFIAKESNFLGRLRRQSSLYGDFSLPRQRWFFIRDLQLNQATAETRTFPIFGLDEDEAERLLAAAAPTDIAGAATMLFAAAAARHDAARWGDKTPAHVFEVEWLASAWPHARFLHIIRDGRAVAASVCKARWVSTMREGGEYWRRRVLAARMAGADLGPARYREVRYESLVEDPERELRDLCAWADLTYCDALLDYHETSRDRLPAEHESLFPLIDKPVDRSRATAWQRDLPRVAIADVECEAGDLLEDLGYPLLGTTVPIWVAAMRHAADHMRPTVRDAWRKIA
ncbi:MAG: sulfotransferase family protein [Planctomycetota bacterium]